MPSNAEFRARIGAVNMPEAVEFIGDPEPGEVAFTPDPLGPVEPFEPFRAPERLDPFRWGGWRVCRTNLLEGCYAVTYRPKGSPWWGNYLAGTVRVERPGSGYRISGDLYRKNLFMRIPWREWEFQPALRFDGLDDAADATGTIPIYPRRDYSSYLKGTRATTFGIVRGSEPCPISLHFGQFDYSHPSSGFSGTFPATANRSIRWSMTASSTPDRYTGKAYNGTTELGTVSMTWVSPHFRRANLELRRLTGAELPPDVDTENLRTVFDSAGWDVTVTKITAAMSKPSSLSSQSATQCWSTSNLHRLMETVPGYDPSVLDREWKAYLLAVPAKMRCSRGVMFDSSGDLNNIKREGAATFSHDGFPKSNSSNFGAAEDELMKDNPRGFLRSAAHEVGHTFNQIHQSFEGGNDNSVMTVTPSVADVLAAGGQTFPDDIDLTFNNTVRRHLVHLPDPAVRPGAMNFFGAAINAPEADNVAVMEGLEVEVEPGTESLRLGEPLSLSWKVVNCCDDVLAVPDNVDIQSMTARVSVTDPRGNRTFIRPVDITVCGSNPVTALDPENERSAEATLFYGSDGFAFSEPGRHTIDLVVIWQVAGAHMMTSGAADVWVAYPLTDNDNQVASLLLDPAVGEAVALGDTSLAPGSEERIAAATKLQAGHPACAQLMKLGLASAPKRSTRKKKA